MSSTRTSIRHSGHLLLLLFLFLRIPLTYAGAPQQQIPPSGDEYDLVILNPTTGGEKVFQMNDYIRLTYDQLSDNPAKNRTLMLAGNLQAVTHDAIKIDGTWIAISSISHISRPTVNGKKMTKGIMNLNVLLIPFFLLLMLFSCLIAILFSLTHPNGPGISQKNKRRRSMGFMGTFVSLIMLPVSIVMQPRIKKRVNKKRILMARKKGE